MPTSWRAARSRRLRSASTGSSARRPRRKRCATGSARPGDEVTLGIRPEALRPDPNGALSGEVRLVERLGGLTLLHVALPGGASATVQIEGSDGTQAHQPIRLAADPASCHLFDGAGASMARLMRHPLAA